MSDYAGIWRRISRRLLVAVVPGALGWAVFGWLPGPLGFLMGTALLLVTAVVMAGPIAELFAEPAGSLFYPGGEIEEIPPMYGIPESRRKNGLPEEAMAEYERIEAAYPQELKPYVDMIDIAIVDLHDPGRAEAIYRRGMETLEADDRREALRTMYDGIRTRLATLAERARTGEVVPLHGAGGRTTSSGKSEGRSGPAGSGTPPGR